MRLTLGPSTSCTSEQAMVQISETEARLNSHEAVCQLRYEAINARLKRLETILMVAAGAIITGLAGIAFKLH
jgi:hypothetical protein